jgi:hypothetical protein
VMMKRNEGAAQAIAVRDPSPRIRAVAAYEPSPRIRAVAMRAVAACEPLQHEPLPCVAMRATAIRF